MYVFAVAPHAGAWIEIEMNRMRLSVGIVAPYAGAWIIDLVAALHDCGECRSNCFLVSPLTADIWHQLCTDKGNEPYAANMIEMASVGISYSAACLSKRLRGCFFCALFQKPRIVCPGTYLLKEGFS